MLQNQQMVDSSPTDNLEQIEKVLYPQYMDDSLHHTQNPIPKVFECMWPFRIAQKCLNHRLIKSTRTSTTEWQFGTSPKQIRIFLNMHQSNLIS